MVKDDRKVYRPGWRDRSRERKSFRRFERMRSVLVKALPIAGVILGVFAFSWKSLKESYEELMIPISFKQKMEEAHSLNFGNQMINPKLSGVDLQGKPVSIEADQAVQKNQQETTLANPRGMIHLQDGTPLHFEADRGVFQKETNNILLVGHVHLQTATGYNLRTTEASFSLQSGLGGGDLPVKGTGPQGEQIDASGFKIDQKQNKFTFTGRTRWTLGP